MMPIGRYLSDGSSDTWQIPVNNPPLQEPICLALLACLLNNTNSIPACVPFMIMSGEQYHRALLTYLGGAAKVEIGNVLAGDLPPPRLLLPGYIGVA